MDVACTAGVQSWDDGGERPAASPIRSLITPQAIAGIIVLPVSIRLPQFHDGIRDRAAGTIDHMAAEGFLKIDYPKLIRVSDDPVALLDSFELLSG